MSRVKLSGKLPDPKESDKDGLGVLLDLLLADPKDTHLVIGLVRNSKTEVDYEKGGLRTPQAAFKHIEVVTEDDQKIAERVLASAYRDRTGQTVMLPEFGDQADGK